MRLCYTSSLAASDMLTAHKQQRMQLEEEHASISLSPEGSNLMFVSATTGVFDGSFSCITWPRGRRGGTEYLILFLCHICYTKLRLLASEPASQRVHLARFESYLVSRSGDSFPTCLLPGVFTYSCKGFWLEGTSMQWRQTLSHNNSSSWTM